MVENGFITPEEAEVAKAEQLKLRALNPSNRPHAEFVAEMVRQSIVSQYGEEAYTRGLVVTTTIKANEQLAAYRAVRQGVLDYERRQFYRGPELFIDLPEDKAARDDAIDEALTDRPDNDDLLSAVVLEANAKRVVAVRQDGEPFEITGEGLKPVQSGLSDKAGPNVKIRPGAVIRVVQTAPRSGASHSCRRSSRPSWRWTRVPAR